jgi:hypothetical protein
MWTMVVGSKIDECKPCRGVVVGACEQAAIEKLLAKAMGSDDLLALAVEQAVSVTHMLRQLNDADGMDVAERTGVADAGFGHHVDYTDARAAAENDWFPPTAAQARARDDLKLPRVRRGAAATYGGRPSVVAFEPLETMTAARLDTEYDGLFLACLRFG